MSVTSEDNAVKKTKATFPAIDAAKPLAALPSFADSWKFDLLSGFLVFLIALPLCLGIAKASQFPPIAGVFTAVIGGMLAGLFSNSELTIKGPAAGMIAIVAGAMLDENWLGRVPVVSPGTGVLETYQWVLAVGVIAGALQILLSLCRAGILAEFFPMAPVHGLLASIGFIIIAKQSHLVFGFASSQVAKQPIDATIQLKDVVLAAQWQSTVIGLLSLVILFGYPWAKKRLKFLGPIPAQLVVLLIAIPLGQIFHLPADRLVNLPDKITDAIVFPDFSHSFSGVAIKWVALFCLVGSLESLLSAKAIDILDPWKRKTNMNRDLLGVGVANTVSAAVGGLPMISEILRSSANIGNGGRTRLANAFHGAFLLLSIVVLAFVVKMIPLAALGAMLVFAGFRLASPKEFLHMWRSGKGQFFVFCLTIACIYPHGELLFVGFGMAAELLINFFNGASVRDLFKPRVKVESGVETSKLTVESALTFSNWIAMRNTIERLNGARTVEIDLSGSRLVDRTASDKLRQLRRDFAGDGRSLELIGLHENGVAH